MGIFARPRTLLALGIFAAGVLVIPARLFIGDPYTWREEAINLVLFHRLEIPERIALGHGEPSQYFTRNPGNGAYYSKYGIMSGLLNVPPLWAEWKVTGNLPAWDSKYRRLFLGFFYAVLGALFAWTLHLACTRFVASSRAATLYVLAVVFATYAGYYLRATNSEAYQLLFFTLLFERFAAYRESGFRERGRLHAAWLWLACLVLVKVSHLMVGGVLALLVGVAEWRERRARGAALARALCVHVALPLAAVAAAQGAMNHLKFGSPFRSGYTLWQGEAFAHDIPPLQILRNVFLSQQWGVPAHFPLLVLALFGARRFARRFPYELALAGGSFLLAVAVIGSMPVWKGEWAYGPRYFLFCLPALAMPFLFSLEDFLGAAEGRRRAAVLAEGAVSVLVLSFSLWLQVQVARLDPFFCYWARPNIARYGDAEVKRYWETTHFGLIAARAWAGREDPEALWWVRRLKDELPAKDYEAERTRIREWLARTNFWWWSPRDK